MQARQNICWQRSACGSVTTCGCVGSEGDAASLGGPREEAIAHLLANGALQGIGGRLGVAELVGRLQLIALALRHRCVLQRLINQHGQGVIQRFKAGAAH